MKGESAVEGSGGLAVEHLGDGPAEGVGRERLGEEVDRSQLHRGHGVGDAPMSGDDDHGNIIARGPELFEHVHPAHFGHLEVEQHEVGGVASEPGQRGLAVLGGGELGAGRFQGRAEDEPDVGLVVNNQDMPGDAHVGSPSRTAGPSPL
jgi:hypothetical protein